MSPILTGSAEAAATAAAAAATTAATAPVDLVPTVEPGVVCLHWDEIAKGQGQSLAVKLYQAVALLRQRCHGDRVSFASDEVGLHILQPFGEVEAAARRARSQGGGRLNGDVLGACLLLPDAAGAGVALVQAFCMQRDGTSEERAACAAALLERAIVEAAVLKQTAIGVAALPAALSVEGANWLSAAGFDDSEAARQEQVYGRAAAGVVWRRIGEHDTLR